MTDPLQRHQQIGYQLFASASYERAAREFESALALEPGDNYARLMRVRCLLELKRLPEARREVEIALQNAPDDSDAHFMASYVAPNPKKALLAIDAALKLEPFHAEYHQYRAYILARLNRFALSLESAQRALEIDPDDARAHRQIAHTLFDEADGQGTGIGKIGLSRAKRDLAARHVAIALRLEPDNALMHDAAARLEEFDQEYETSLEKWQETLRLDPTNEYALYMVRRARSHVQIARCAERIWRFCFGWMPWPLRLPLALALVGWSRHFNEVLFYLGLMLVGFETPLLLRDWLQWVPDRFLHGSLHSLKKPPLR